MGLMSLILFLPILGSLVLLFMPRDVYSDYAPGYSGRYLKVVSLIFAFVTFLLSLPLLFEFGLSSSSFFGSSAIISDGKVVGFEELVPWINLDVLGINSSYHLKIDGISLLLFVLTTLLTPLIMIGAWHAIEVRVKEFLICMLLMETGMLGAFMAWDLLLFYLFWEIMLVPMYFIVGIWGGQNKVYAAVKFFIYTMVGSLLMFLAIIYIYIGVGSFDLNIIYAKIYTLSDSFNVFGYSLDIEYILFFAFALSFAIKVPIFPFHTWLPDAHVEAPTAGSVILAGVLLKMGTYGFIRFAIPFFPNASFSIAPYISVIALIGIIYGAFMALAQSDIKKLIAYSSISHLGFVMLGLFSFSGSADKILLSYQAVQGAIYQMVNHGISTGALFMLVGIIYERRHTKDMSEFGGLAKVMPIYSVIFMITMLASIGLPGLNGFVGEFLILLGAFKANWVYGSIGTLGVIFGAVYMLVLYQRVFFGKCSNPKNKELKDVVIREIVSLSPLIIMMIVMGIFPGFFLDKIAIALNSMFDLIPYANITWML